MPWQAGKIAQVFRTRKHLLGTDAYQVRSEDAYYGHLVLRLEVFDALKEIAAKRGITLTEAVRQAISTEKFMQDTLDTGGIILTQDRDGKMMRVHFR